MDEFYCGGCGEHYSKKYLYVSGKPGRPKCCACAASGIARALDVRGRPIKSKSGAFSSSGFKESSKTKSKKRLTPKQVSKLSLFFGRVQ